MIENGKKMMFALVAILAASAVSVTSCDKDTNVESNVEPGRTTKESLDPGPQHREDTVFEEVAFYMDSLPMYLNGKPCSSIDGIDTDRMIALVFDSAIYYFDSDSDLKSFCEDNEMYYVYTINTKMDLLYDSARRMGVADQDLELDNVPEAIKAYWRDLFGAEFGQPLPTRFDKSGDTKRILTLRLYDNANLGNPNKLFGGPTAWSLGNFNNRTSSFKTTHQGNGWLWMCHKTGYGRPRIAYYTFAFGFGQMTCLSIGGGSNNKFCSYFSTI